MKRLQKWGGVLAGPLFGMALVAGAEPWPYAGLVCTFILVVGPGGFVTVWELRSSEASPH